VIKPGNPQVFNTQRYSIQETRIWHLQSLILCCDLIIQLFFQGCFAAEKALRCMSSEASLNTDASTPSQMHVFSASIDFKQQLQKATNPTVVIPAGFVFLSVSISLDYNAFVHLKERGGGCACSKATLTTQ
jgi:hypothetical protein